MPLDDRLRNAFERSAASIEPSVEANLEQVLRRGSRPRQLRLGPMVAAAAVIVLLVLGSRYVFPNQPPVGPVVSPSPSPTVSPNANAIAGSYVVTLNDEDAEVADLGMSGVWSMTLRSGGGMDVTPPSTFEGSQAAGHTFTVEGSVFRTDLYYNDFCDSIGIYEWSSSQTGLTLQVADDDCAIRRVLLSTREWTVTN
jgi:hypothetical protein